MNWAHFFQFSAAWALSLQYCIVPITFISLLKQPKSNLIHWFSVLFYCYKFPHFLWIIRLQSYEITTDKNITGIKMWMEVCTHGGFCALFLQYSSVADVILIRVKVVSAYYTRHIFIHSFSPRGNFTLVRAPTSCLWEMGRNQLTPKETWETVTKNWKAVRKQKACLRYLCICVYQSVWNMSDSVQTGHVIMLKLICLNVRCHYQTESRNVFVSYNLKLNCVPRNSSSLPGQIPNSEPRLEEGSQEASREPHNY